MRLSRIVVIVALFAAVAWSEAFALEPGREGWQTWRVESLGKEFDACCFSGKSIGCNLERRKLTFLAGHDCSDVAGYVQVYALMREGVPEQIHLLSSECPVDMGAELRDLGDTSADETVQWLHGVATSLQENAAQDQAIFALSQFPGNVGVSELVAVIESRDVEKDMREQALFWLASSESDEALAYLDHLLSSD